MRLSRTGNGPRLPQTQAASSPRGVSERLQILPAPSCSLAPTILGTLLARSPALSSCLASAFHAPLNCLFRPHFPSVASVDPFSTASSGISTCLMESFIVPCLRITQALITFG